MKRNLVFTGIPETRDFVNQPINKIQPESWMQTGKRNLGAVTEELASVPDIAKTLVGGPSPEPSFRNVPQDIEQENIQRQQSGFQPITQEQIQGSPQTQQPEESFRQTYLNTIGTPEGFGEAKNFGETAARWAAVAIPQIIASGGASTPTEFAKSILQYLGVTAGAKAGAPIGGYLGKKLGQEERGQILGGLGGGVLGGAATNYGYNRISGKFNELIDESARKQYASKKELDLAVSEAEYGESLAKAKKNLNEHKINFAKEQESFQKQKNSTLAELKSEHDKTIKQLENQRKARLVDLKKERDASLKNLKYEHTAYEAQIPKLDIERQPLYTEAEKRAVGLRASADKLGEELTKLKETLNIGVSKKDKSTVNSYIEGILDEIPRGKHNPNKGNLLLEKAITAQKNINAKIEELRIYQPQPYHNKKTVVGGKLQKAVKSINEFIEDAGKQHPEHAEVYKPAESKSQQIGSLKKGREEFKDIQKAKEKAIYEDYRQEVSDIKRGEEFKDAQNQYNAAKTDITNEKFPSLEKIHYQDIERDLRKELGNIESDANKAKKIIGDKTYEKYLSENAPTETIDKIISKASRFLNKGGLAAFGTALAKISGLSSSIGALAYPLLGAGGQLVSEVSFIKSVINNHPELYTAQVNALKDVILKQTPHNIKAVVSINNHIGDMAKKEQQRKHKARKLVFA